MASIPAEETYTRERGQPCHVSEVLARWLADLGAPAWVLETAGGAGREKAPERLQEAA